jgi:hypothetical protein
VRAIGVGGIHQPVQHRGRQALERQQVAQAAVGAQL